MEKVTFIRVFTDYLEAMEPLGDAEKGRLFTSLLTYARTGAVPQLSGNERFIFPMMRAQIDRDNSVAAELSEQRSEAAKKAYISRCSKSKQVLHLQAKEAFASKSSTCQLYNDNDNDNDYTPPNNPPSSGGPRDVFAEFSGENADLLAALRDYSAMRVKLKKPMTDRAKQLAIGKLRELSGEDPTEMIRILEQSIANSWQGLFPLRDAQQAQKPWKQKTAARDAEPNRLDPLVMKAIQRAVNGGNADGNA